MKICTATKMMALDQKAINDLEIKAEFLKENAGYDDVFAWRQAFGIRDK